MPIPDHTLNIFQKPKLGNAQLARYKTFNYKHRINAIGWFDTASCDIAVRVDKDPELFLDQFIGNRVEVIVDNPVEPCWEGFINRLTLNLGGIQYTISLDEMANQVNVQYSINTISPVKTAKVSNASSQGVFGIKHETVDLGAQNSVNTPTFNALRDNILAQRAWPKASTMKGSGSNGILRVEMSGFYHTLEWEDYTDTLTGNIQLRNFITTLIMPGLQNGATFFDNTDFTDVGTNTLSLDRNKLRGTTVWDVLQEIQEYGDATNFFVMGITPTIFATGKRRFYYRALNANIEYTVRKADGLIIRNVFNRKVDPWRVVPDRGVKLSDALIGWNGLGDNPLETYVFTIEYDANLQQAVYRGDDDRSAEGIFNLRRYSKSYGKRFVPRRLA